MGVDTTYRLLVRHPDRSGGNTRSLTDDRRYDLRDVMKYVEPLVQIVSSYQEHGITRLSLQLLRTGAEFSGPFAPASLHDPENPSNFVIELHRCIHHDETTLVYDSYTAGITVPLEKEQFVLRLWWTQDQMDIVTDTAIKWTLLKYPDDRDHDHCELTWETIAAYGEYQHEGYHSDYGWITVDAYHKYIENDIPRIRM